MRCGQCEACRIDKRRVWAHRIKLEALNHTSSCFLTLTYSDQNLPKEFVHPETGQVFAANSVSPFHHRKFMDKLRFHYRKKTGQCLRFYMCGEYGEKTQRPHYHYALFGMPTCLDLASRSSVRFQPCSCSVCKLYSDAWGLGHIFAGDLTIDSANYVAGYVTKKMTMDKCNCDKQGRDTHHPKCPFLLLHGRHPEFSRQSNKPGVAAYAADRIKERLTFYGMTNHDDLPRALAHGSKLLPLGRYLSDKLNEKMGFEFTPKEKLGRYQASLRNMLYDPKNSPEVIRAASSSVEIALQMLNSQRCLDLEKKRQLFAKEKIL